MSLSPKQVGKVFTFADIAASGALATVGLNPIERHRALVFDQATAGVSVTLPTPADVSVIFGVDVFNLGAAAVTVQGTQVEAGGGFRVGWNGTSWVALGCCTQTAAFFAYVSSETGEADGYLFGSETIAVTFDSPPDVALMPAVLDNTSTPVAGAWVASGNVATFTPSAPWQVGTGPFTIDLATAAGVNGVVNSNPQTLSFNIGVLYPLSNTAVDPTYPYWRGNNPGYTFVPNVGIYLPAPLTNAVAMFAYQSSFNDPDIALWDMSTVTTTQNMFAYASSFDQDLSGWDMSNVTNTGGMFMSAVAFNQDISGWDVSNVTSMATMFSGAASFNQDIGNWDVSSVTGMAGMFNSAIAFDQDLSGWCVTNIVTAPNAFSSGTLGSWTAAEMPVWGTCPVPLTFALNTALTKPTGVVRNAVGFDFFFDDAVPNAATLPTPRDGSNVVVPGAWSQVGGPIPGGPYLGKYFAKFVPSSTLPDGTVIEFDFTSSVMSASGDALSNPVTYTYTLDALMVVSAVSGTDADNVLAVGTTEPITITFTEDTTLASVQASVVRNATTNSNVAGTWAAGGNQSTFVFTPSAAWVDSASGFTVSVSAQAQSDGANLYPPSSVFSFTAVTASGTMMIDATLARPSGVVRESSYFNFMFTELPDEATLPMPTDATNAPHAGTWNVGGPITGAGAPYDGKYYAGFALPLVLNSGDEVNFDFTSAVLDTGGGALANPTSFSYTFAPFSVVSIATGSGADLDLVIGSRETIIVTFTEAVDIATMPLPVRGDVFDTAFPGAWAYGGNTSTVVFTPDDVWYQVANDVRLFMYDRGPGPVNDGSPLALLDNAWLNPADEGTIFPQIP